MKPGKIQRYLLLLLMITGLILSSCQKEDDPYEDNLYLKASEKLFGRSEQFFYNLVATASATYPEVLVLLNEVNDGADIYRIEYDTEFMGDRLRVSALLCVPKTPGVYPVLSFQNGTNTLLENAPTTNPAYELYQLLQSVASMGYVVAIADYIGFGASDHIFHPYLHKESTVQSLVDLLYATREFGEDMLTDVTISNEVYLTGYSQGGWSTMALLKELENNYSGDFLVKACACGAGPYDMRFFNDYVMELETYASPGFLAYISKAWIDHEIISKELGDLFKAPYAAAIPQLLDGYHSIDEVHDGLTTSIPALFTEAYLSGYSQGSGYADIRNALDENSVPAWNCQVPLLLVHGQDDVFVPPLLTTGMYDDMIQAGTSAASCSKLLLPGKDHRTGIVPSSVQALLFFKEIRQ